eukprot:15400_1
MVIAMGGCFLALLCLPLCFGFIPGFNFAQKKLRVGYLVQQGQSDIKRISSSGYDVVRWRRLLFADVTSTAVEREMGGKEVVVVAKEKEPEKQHTRFDRFLERYTITEKLSVLEHDPNYPLATEEYDDFSRYIEGQSFEVKKGLIIKGTYVEYDQGGMMVDINRKCMAFMPEREASLAVYKDLQDIPAIVLGGTVKMMIISNENNAGQVLVSVRRVELMQAWEAMSRLKEEDATLEGKIIATNRGGAIVETHGLRAFLPGSHMIGSPTNSDYSALVGSTVNFKFLEVDRMISKLVVSSRLAHLEKEMKKISRGDVVEGFVKAIKQYGAFVQIRGMSGLLHISQITEEHVSDLNNVFSVGQSIKCMIIDHDKANGRIALSTKVLEPEPGDMLRNQKKVFEQAEKTAELYRMQQESEKVAREKAARTIVKGFGDGTRSFKNDILAGIAEGIESVLTSGGGIESGTFSGHDGSQDSITSILDGDTKLRSTNDPLQDIEGGGEQKNNASS